MISPPDSGRMFQEDQTPFWMMVACSLCNLTHWSKVQPVLEKLKALTGVDDSAAHRFKYVDDATLIEVLRPLGFYNRRAAALKLMATFWDRHPPLNAEGVLKLPGCGKYAYHSYMIFVERKRPASPVSDKKLQWYLDQHPEIV